MCKILKFYNLLMPFGNVGYPSEKNSPLKNNFKYKKNK